MTGHDVIADVSTWTAGPLQSSLEPIALKVFARQYAMADWNNPDFSREQNDARRFVLQLRVDFLKLDRWTLSNMVEQLDAAFTGIVCGDRGPSKGEQKQLLEYAESCIEDLFRLFGGDAMAKNLSESWKYVPEDDDTSELEDLGHKAVS